MSIERSIYLIQNGKTLGPFTPTEIEGYRKSEEINQFDWICYNLKQGWVPVEPPPPLPPLTEEDPSEYVTPPKLPPKRQPTASAPPPMKPEPKAPDLSEEILPIAVLCQNYKSIFSGSIRNLQSHGCILTQVSPSSKIMPLLKSGTFISLSLLDWEVSQSENVTAQISGLIKNHGYWEYEVQWKEKPKVLSNYETRKSH